MHAALCRGTVLCRESVWAADLTGVSGPDVFLFNTVDNRSSEWGQCSAQPVLANAAAAVHSAYPVVCTRTNNLLCMCMSCACHVMPPFPSTLPTHAVRLQRKCFPWLALTEHRVGGRCVGVALVLQRSPP